MTATLYGRAALLFSFCSRYLQDRQADLHLIFQEDGKWSTTAKLSFWFLNSFGGGREVENGYFWFWPSFTKWNVAAKRIYLSKKENLSGLGCITSPPNAENHGKIGQRTAEILWHIHNSNSDSGVLEKLALVSFFGAYGMPRERKHGGARLTTLPDYDQCSKINIVVVVVNVEKLKWHCCIKRRRGTARKVTLHVFGCIIIIIIIIIINLTNLHKEWPVYLYACAMTFYIIVRNDRSSRYGLLFWLHEIHLFVPLAAARPTGSRCYGTAWRSVIVVTIT